MRQLRKRDHEIVKKAATPASDCTLVALERPIVLRRARDVPSLGSFLHVVAHRTAGDAIGPTLRWQDVVPHGERLQRGQRGTCILREEVRKPLGRLGRQVKRGSAHDLGPAD